MVLGMGYLGIERRRKGRWGTKGEAPLGNVILVHFISFIFPCFISFFSFFFLKNFSSPHKRLCYHTSLYLCPHGLGIGIANIGR